MTHESGSTGPGEDVPGRSRVRVRWREASEALVAVLSLIVPFLLHTLPLGCTAAAAPPPSTVHRPRRMPGWMARSVALLYRVSAWRNARSSRASVVAGAAGSLGRRAAIADGVSSGAMGLAIVPRVLLEHGGDPDPVPLTLDGRSDEQPQVPIDVVYTWVDDADPAWRARYAAALATAQQEGVNSDAASCARFRNHDELRYSLRSLAMYAPFVRNVFIVTAGQVPDWLDRDAPNLRVVPHEEVLPPECLPTFNSHAIESALHRIDGLAEHYLYLNDDFFFGRGCPAAAFFTSDGRPRCFPDHRAMVPDGPCSPADRAVDSASKNTREIMSTGFDYLVRYKMQHVPYPQRRSVLREMEALFPSAFERTARSTFRHHRDVNIASCLSHYYALANGIAVADRIQASYVNIGNPLAQVTMRRLLQRANNDVFCLNDSPMSERRRTIVDASVTAFLEAYFPAPSPFEVSTDRVASR